MIYYYNDEKVSLPGGIGLNQTNLKCFGSNTADIRMSALLQMLSICVWSVYYTKAELLLNKHAYQIGSGKKDLILAWILGQMSCLFICRNSL